MDPISIALAVGGLLVQAAKAFGKESTKAAATEAGKRVTDAGASVLRRAWESVRKKFAGDSEATEALNLLERRPDNEGLQSEVTAAIQRGLESDLAFAKELGDLIKEATSAGLIVGGDLTSQTVTGDGNMVIGKVASGSTVYYNSGHRD